MRIALNLKGIKFEYRPVHLLKDGGEQLKDDYSAKQPMKQVPLLAIDGVELAQSTAIIYYLDETRSTPALLPDDAVTRARVRQIVDIIGSDTQPVQNLRILKHVMGFFEGGDEKTKQKLAWGKKWIVNGFDALEKVLASTSGKYCVGDEITLADLYVPPQVYNANRFGVDMSAYPTIVRVNDALAKLPAFAEAVPEKQPDAAA